MAVREGYNTSQKKRMLLSEETILGLRMTSKLISIHVYTHVYVQD